MNVRGEQAYAGRVGMRKVIAKRTDARQSRASRGHDHVRETSTRVRCSLCSVVVMVDVIAVVRTDGTGQCGRVA